MVLIPIMTIDCPLVGILSGGRRYSHGILLVMAVLVTERIRCQESHDRADKCGEPQSESYSTSLVASPLAALSLPFSTARLSDRDSFSGGEVCPSVRLRLIPRKI